MSNSLRERFGRGVRRLLSRGTPVLTPLDAYDLWAETYDDIDGNAVLHAESIVISRLLETCTIADCTVLDAGCGTGRHTELLLRKHPRLVAAFDLSPKMLQKAHHKFGGTKSVHLSVADVELPPFKPSTFDFVLCTLVLGHVENLDGPVSQLSSLLKSGGTMVVSIFHPFGQLLGWQRTFSVKGTPDGGGRTFAVQYFRHLFADYVAAFSSSQLDIVGVHEPVVDEETRPFYERAGRLDLYNEFRGYPLVLVVKLRKQ